MTDYDAWLTTDPREAQEARDAADAKRAACADALAEDQAESQAWWEVAR